MGNPVIVVPDSSSPEQPPSVPLPIAEDLAANARATGEAQALEIAANQQRAAAESEAAELRQRVELLTAQNTELATNNARLEGLVAGAVLAADAQTPEPPTPALSDGGEPKIVEPPPPLPPAAPPEPQPKRARGLIARMFHGRS
jgi:hypothetical protein